MQEYVPLWCKSNFSFLEGASHPEELIETCASLGIETMALTLSQQPRQKQLHPLKQLAAMVIVSRRRNNT